MKRKNFVAETLKPTRALCHRSTCDTHVKGCPSFYMFQNLNINATSNEYSVKTCNEPEFMSFIHYSLDTDPVSIQ